MTCGSGDSPAHQPAQSLGRGTVLVTAASALFVLSGYLVNITLGRTLGPADYGLFGVVIGLMSVLNAVQSASIPQAVAKFTAEQRESSQEILAAGLVVQLVVGIVLGVALFLLADAVAGLLGDEALVEPLRITALALPPYSLFLLLLGYSGGLGQYSRQALMLSAYAIAKAAFAVGLSIVWGLAGAIGGYVLAALVALPTSGIRRFPMRRLASLRPMLRYSLPLVLVALVSIGHLNLDLFFVKGLVAGAEESGYYTAAQSIARVPFFLTTGFAIILLPAVARAAAGNPRSAQGLVREALRVGFLIVAPLAALLAGAADDVVQLLYTDAYEPATPALMVLSPAMACFALSALLASLLAGVGRAVLALIAGGAGLLSTGILCFVLVPPQGTVGAAVATLVGAILALAIAGVAAFQVFSSTISWASVARGAAASLVIGIAASMLDGTAATLVGLPLLAATYAALLILMREVKREDWQRMAALGRARVLTNR